MSRGVQPPRSIAAVISWRSSGRSRSWTLRSLTWRCTLPVPSTNLLERSLEEIKRRTKVIGRFPGETSCLSLCWAVLDLFIDSARGLALTALEHRQLGQMRADRRAQTPESLSA